MSNFTGIVSEISEEKRIFNKKMNKERKHIDDYFQ